MEILRCLLPHAKFISAKVLHSGFIEFLLSAIDTACPPPPNMRMTTIMRQQIRKEFDSFSYLRQFYDKYLCRAAVVRCLLFRSILPRISVFDVVEFFSSPHHPNTIKRFIIYRGFVVRLLLFSAFRRSTNQFMFVVVINLSTSGKCRWSEGMDAGANATALQQRKFNCLIFD